MYKRWHSTETSLISTIDFILCAIDQKKIIAVAYVDMSKAFDTIKNLILLNNWRTSVYQPLHSNGSKAIFLRD